MREIFIKYLSVALFAGFLFSGQAQAGETPATLAGGKIVSAEEVTKDAAAGAVIVDTRVAYEYAEEHIKGAVSVPYREKSKKVADFDVSKDQFDVSKLPSDKSKAVVMYCNGPACWKSYKASVAAVKAGYTNVNWYRAGIPDWKSKGHPVE